MINAGTHFEKGSEFLSGNSLGVASHLLTAVLALCADYRDLDRGAAEPRSFGDDRVVDHSPMRRISNQY